MGRGRGATIAELVLLHPGHLEQHVGALARLRGVLDALAVDAEQLREAILGDKICSGPTAPLHPAPDARASLLPGNRAPRRAGATCCDHWPSSRSRASLASPSSSVATWRA